MAAGLDLSGIQQFSQYEDPTTQTFRALRCCQDTTRKRSFLLYLAGPDVEKIFESIPDNGEEKDYDVAATRLTEYFAPKKNIMYEIQLFRKAQ